MMEVGPSHVVVVEAVDQTEQTAVVAVAELEYFD